MSDPAKLKPLQLISFDSNRSTKLLNLVLKVNKEAIDLLTGLNAKCRNLAIITVVGKYRTGKSYILNRVLLRQNCGFQVGPTINACTKGLWIWPEPVQITEGEEPVYALVMDTEGLGSLEEGENTDTKIFLMAMLLSSYFIYNSVGNIDEKAIQSLSLIVNLSKLLQKGNPKDMEDIINCFPSFLWLVRDFALRLEDDKGKAILPHEYLANALKLQQGKSDMVERKNSIRKELITFFKDRDCFMLIRPTNEQSKLQRLASLKDSDLRPEFLQLVNDLRVKVFGQVKRKMFKGKPCSPVMFIEMCQFFCDAINRGDLPQIESNWDLVCKAEANRVSKHCEAEFGSLLAKYERMHTHEVNLEQFQKEIEQKMTDLLKYFEKNAMGDKDKFKKEIRKGFKKHYEEVKESLEKEKNRELESAFYQTNEGLSDRISANQVRNIFDISEEFDRMIELHSAKANKETMSVIHRKCYEGLKATTINFFSTLKQSQQLQSNILTEKLNLYQNSYTNLQAECTKKNEEADSRERELKNRIYTLEFKSKEAADELARAKLALEEYNRKEAMKENQNIGNKPIGC